MIDLHTHSTFSDGSCSPTELVQLAKNIGLSAIALTDHNTISGLEEFEKAGKKYDIETISSIEISTETNDEDFHIIALFIKQDHYNAIEAYLKCAIDSKIESNKLLVKNLNRSGYNISYDQIVKENGSENFNRVAIANKLMEKGYVQSIKGQPIKFCVNHTPSSNNRILDYGAIRLSDLPRVNFSFLSAECYARRA